MLTNNRLVAQRLPIPLAAYWNSIGGETKQGQFVFSGKVDRSDRVGILLNFGAYLFPEKLEGCDEGQCPVLDGKIRLSASTAGSSVATR